MKLIFNLILLFKKSLVQFVFFRAQWKGFFFFYKE